MTNATTLRSQLLPLAQKALEQANRYPVRHVLQETIKELAAVVEELASVTELLAANTREVERRREAEEEVGFWCREMLATLETAMALHSAAVVRHDEDRTADIRANRIRPILGAFRDANAKDWFERCECCGEFLRPEQPYALIGDDPDGMMRVHATCIDAAEGFRDRVDGGNAILTAARALVTYDDDTPADASIGLADEAEVMKP